MWLTGKNAVLGQQPKGAVAWLFVFSKKIITFSSFQTQHGSVQVSTFISTETAKLSRNIYSSIGFSFVDCGSLFRKIDSTDKKLLNYYSGLKLIFGFVHTPTH